jgi:hypothetical protein
VRRRGKTVQMPKRAVINDPLQGIAGQFTRAGHACRSGAREALAIASPVFLIDAKGKLSAGLVHAETI